MAKVLNASQMQKLQEVLVKRLFENTVFDYWQITNAEFLSPENTMGNIIELQ